MATSWNFQAAKVVSVSSWSIHCILAYNLTLCLYKDASLLTCPLLFAQILLPSSQRLLISVNPSTAQFHGSTSNATLLYVAEIYGISRIQSGDHSQTIAPTTPIGIAVRSGGTGLIEFEMLDASICNHLYLNIRNHCPFVLQIQKLNLQLLSSGWQLANPQAKSQRVVTGCKT